VLVAGKLHDVLREVAELEPPRPLRPPFLAPPPFPLWFGFHAPPIPPCPPGPIPCAFIIAAAAIAAAFGSPFSASR
jgi:hypothetical protein